MADLMPDTMSPPIRGRSDEILDSIRATFAEKGFDGASMQDLAKAAGMSVGNFYRYFPSKAAIVEAIVTRDLHEVEREISAIGASDDPKRHLREGLHKRVEQECQGCADGPLWAEISAAALRKPEIAAIVGRMEADVCRYLTNAFAMVSGLTEAAAAERFSAHAAMVVMLVKASAMQARAMQAGAMQAGAMQAAGGACQPELTALILRMFDTMLDEITQTAVKG